METLVLRGGGRVVGYRWLYLRFLVVLFRFGFVGIFNIWVGRGG